MQHWLGKIRSGSYLIAIFSTVLLFFYCYSSEAQTPFAFQGNETGDSWNFTAVTNNLSASYVRTGSGSIRAGGGNNTNCGDCINGSGTGNCSGTHISTEIRFVDKDVSCFTGVQLELYYGNYHPACNGTGWDSGEDLYFQAYHDGVAQTAVMLEDGSANLQVPYKRFTYSVPNGLNSFSFRMYILGNTDRRDEFLFMDDVQLTYTSFGGTATSDETICPNETADLFFDCNTGIQWEESTDNVNWTNAAGASTSQNYTTPALTQTTYYRVRLTDTDPEVYSNVLTVTVQGSCCTPLSGVSIAGDNTICQDEIDTYTASFTNGDGPVSYSWTVNGGTINGSSTNSTVNITWDGSGTRSVSVTLTNACSSESETYNVSISQPTVSITQDPNPICAGEDVDLQVSTSAGASFTWDDDNSSTNPRSISNPSNNDSYSVTALDGNGCENTASINIQVTPLPAAPANQTVEYCLNESASQLSPNGAQYNWYDAGMNPLPNAPTPNTSSAGSTTYFVSETANDCEGPSGEVSVVVHDLPTGSITQNPNPVCDGEDAQLTVTLVAGASFVWDDNNSSTNPRIITAPSNGDSYSITITDGNNCEGTANISIQVAPLPTVSITQDPAPICAGEDVDLQVSTSAGASFAWDDDNSSTNPRSISSPNNNDSYSVTALDGNGCENTASINIQVNPLPAAPANQTVEYCQNESTTQLNPNGAQYNWYDAGMNPLPNAPTPNTSSAGSTTYFVSETANGCEGPSGEVTVVVHALPTGSIAQNPTPVCDGEDAQLVVTLGAGASFVWDDNNSTTNPRIITTPSNGDSYSITITDGNNCEGTANISIQVAPLPTVSITQDPAPICAGEDVDLQVSTSAGASFTWDDDNSSTNPRTIISPSNNDTYSLTATDGNNCINTASYQIQVTTLPVTPSDQMVTYCLNEPANQLTPNGVQFRWYDENMNPLPAAPTPNTSTVASYTFFVSEGGNNCESEKGEVTVVVHDLPTGSITQNPNPVCDREDAQLVVTLGAGASFVWDDNNSTTKPRIITAPSNGDSYSITITDGNNCEATANISILVAPLPTVSITQDPTPICAGEDVDLQVSTSAGASFTWDDDNSSTNPRSISSPNNNDSYSVTAVDGNGCENTASINIQVTSLPGAPANQTVEYCLNESASQLSPNGVQYNWYDAGMNPLPNAPTPNTSSAGSTTYFVSETANGCEGPSAEVQVTVFDLPAVVAQASPEEICTGEFSTISTSGAESYVWRDDQSTSDTRFENPATSRTYTVDGIDANGCENSASVTLSVNPLPNVQVTADENPICEGESTNLNASGAVNYTWLDDNSTSANRLVAPTNTTTYTVEGENANGCVNTATIILQVNALPAKPADQQIEICQFSPATQLTPNTANFEWFDENMLALSQAPTPPTDNVGTQTYFYRELLNGCAGELAEVIVEIVQKPSAFLDRSRSVCQFSAVTQLSPNSVEFVWYDEDDNLIGSAPTPPTDEPLDSIFFFRRELNGCSSDRARFFFQVKEKPETPSDNNFRFCYGETSYQLIPNDADINWMDENFNPLPEAPTPNTTNSGDYVYHIARELDACQSDTVVIDVRIENEITPFSGFQTTYCQFETAVPINPGTGTAEWFDEQGNPLGNINPTPQTATAGFTSYEARRVINGCTSSLASFPVQVVARPQTPVVPISPLEYCQDDPNVPVLQPAGNPYMWYNELGNELGSNYVPPVSSVDTVKFYVREIETVNNCRSLPDSVLVITKLKPQTPAPGNFGPYCQFEAATALQPAGGNYEWFELNEQTNQFESRGNTVIPSTQVPGNTTFSVVETINGCSSDAASMVLNVKPKPSAPVVNSPVFYCQNESASPLTANANPGNQFNWYGANYNPLPGVPTPSTNSVGNTDYYVSQTLNGCESDTTGPLVVTVRQRPSFTVNAGTACPGENFPISFSFNGTAPFDVRFIDQANGTAQDVRVSQNPGLIQWSQEGNFTVQLLNDNHCNAINQSSSIQLQRFVAPTVSLSVREDKCARSTFVVADFSGTPNFSFNWIRPGGISQPSGTGALKDSIQVNQVGAVRLSNLSDANCPAANSPSVNVNKVDYAVPSPMVFAPRLCEGGMTTVAISNLEPGTETVLRFNGESYNFTQDRVFDFNDLAVGCYDLEIFAIDPVANCSTAVDRYSDALCVEPNPIADFELEPAVTFDEANRTVFNRSFGASSYAWLVNGENVSTDFNLTYDFGVYESASADVCLEATMVFSNNLMCYDTLCRNLNVEGGAPVYLPNAFTPEVNGVNDTWGASTDGFFDYFNLRVYDRWGALIYTGYSPTDRWDGRYKGSLVSPGVYSYRVDFRYKNTVGEKEILGTVTVLH